MPCQGRFGRCCRGMWCAQGSGLALARVNDEAVSFLMFSAARGAKVVHDYGDRMVTECYFSDWFRLFGPFGKNGAQDVHGSIFVFDG